MTGFPEVVLRTHGLHAWAGGRPLLQDVAITLVAGEIGCLVGANGCGKTTLSRVLAGVSKASVQGNIEIDRDVGVGALSTSGVAFAVPAEWLPSEITGRAVMLIARRALGVGDTSEAYAYAGLVGLDRYLDDPIASYSLGTRQKLSIALAFSAPARLVILDEALSGLDVGSSEATLDYLRSRLVRRRGAALLVSHSIELVQRVADVVWFMAGGRIEETWRRPSGGTGTRQTSDFESLVRRYLRRDLEHGAGSVVLPHLPVAAPTALESKGGGE